MCPAAFVEAFHDFQHVEGLAEVGTECASAFCYSLGNIGKKVAALVTAFGAQVIYYDIVRQTEQEEAFGYRFVDMDTLLSESDILSIHCPLDESTVGMIGQEAISLSRSVMFMLVRL